MTKFIRLFAVVFFLSGGAQAAEIPIRSGAHATFARLVLDVPARTSWVLEKQPNGARISIQDHSDGFDASEVFDRIDRSFVSSVQVDQSSLKIEFGCQCEATVFRSGASMIVIDVSEISPEQRKSEVDFPETSFQFVGEVPLAFSSIQGPRTQQIPIESVVTSTADAMKPDMQVTLVEQTTTIPLPKASRQTDHTSLQQAQQKLAERIGFATTTGVLRPTNQRVTISEAAPRPQIDTRIFDSSLPDPNDPYRRDPVGGNLRISSSNDIPSATDVLSNSTTQGVRCISPTEVRVQDWSGSGDFATSIGMLRRALFSEFDNVNEETALALARRYIYFGFGAEALQVLGMSPSPINPNRSLVDMARIMENGSAGPESYLGYFTDCDSDLALWAILSNDEIDPSMSINSDAAIRTLSGLPLHLRRFIAPLLSKKLLTYGDEEAASAALRGLERTSAPLPSAAELAMARIEMVQGDDKQAQERLGKIVASNDQQSAEALIHYIDSHLDADVEVDQDIAMLVEAYAIEMRDDPLGAELRRTHVLALAKSGQFAAAFRALDLMRPETGSEQSKDTHSSLMVLLAKNADDVTFLNHAFDAMTQKPEQISASAANLLTKRLTRLGFFKEAEKMLAARDDVPSSAQNRILRAEISLGLERPREALVILGDIEGFEADSLRAQARASAGDYDIAHEMYGALGDEVGRLQSAWLSENWQALLEPSDPVIGSAIEVASSPLNTSADLDGMLQRTEDTLRESERARSVIEQILTAEDVIQPIEN